METVGVNILRRNLTGVLKRVEKGEIIMITSRGHEVARLVPPEKKMVKSRKMLEKLRKTAYVGDVVSPHSEDWKVLK
ncbi:MAG: type II toxin-antitoxin system prevent-host-death family antitoxin [Candidatus Aminicenantes bacterium]|nr:type II toxin-antitoxin system prevent-host-death family antitoxin [Candidatus Aminicenantes bacterium]